MQCGGDAGMPHHGGLGEEDCGRGGDLMSSGEKRKSKSERFDSEGSSVEFRFWVHCIKFYSFVNL